MHVWQGNCCLCELNGCPEGFMFTGVEVTDRQQGPRACGLDMLLGLGSVHVACSEVVAI